MLLTWKRLEYFKAGANVSGPGIKRRVKSREIQGSKDSGARLTHSVPTF